MSHGPGKDQKAGMVMGKYDVATLWDGAWVVVVDGWQVTYDEATQMADQMVRDGARVLVTKSDDSCETVRP